MIVLRLGWLEARKATGLRRHVAEGVPSQYATVAETVALGKRRGIELKVIRGRC